MTRHIDVLVIDADSSKQPERRSITADGIGQALNGGMLEAFGGGVWSGYCDEEGKFKGLPFNVRATRLARALGWRTDDVLCGPVVFLGDADENGADTSVTPQVLDAARALGYLPS